MLKKAFLNQRKELKTKSSTSSFVPQKEVSSLPKKMKLDLESECLSEDCWDPNDLYRSNVFLMIRNYCEDGSNHFSYLEKCLKFSKLVVDIAYDNTKDKKTCILTTTVENQVLKLGEADSVGRRDARRKAATNALENLIQKCFIIEINNKYDEGKHISLAMLADEYLDPHEICTPIGRNVIDVAFKNNIKIILDEMKNEVLSTNDNIVRDVVFSRDLSDEQRKYIFRLVNKEYKELTAVTYSTGSDQNLVIKPNLEGKSLIHKVLLLGGTTDNYKLYKPGKLSIDELLFRI